MKRCTLCKQEKEISEFYKNKRSPDGYGTRCKPCNREYSDAWNKANPERVRASWKKKEERYRQTGIAKARRYGLTVEDYNVLVEKHSGRCAICDKEALLHIDHNHKNGVVRGMLCLQCNTGLGSFYDDWELLSKAIQYLGA